MFNKEDASKFFKFLNHAKFTEVRVIDPHADLIKDIFVDNLNGFLAVCEEYNSKANIYVGVNERSSKEGKSENVPTLQIIPLDIDPIRPKGEASTDAELEITRQKMLEIKKWLKENFTCSPFISMSGNGYHILIKIPPMPLDNFNRAAIRANLEVFIHEIQEKFNDEKVHIDSTFDLPRVMKVPGTMSVKGENTKERPWRMCTIIELNDVPCANILAYLAGLAIKKAPTLELGTKTWTEFDAILQKDEKVRDLFEGNWKKYNFKSRSEADQSLLTKLVSSGFSEEVINGIMSQCKIGKWQEKEAYRRISIERAKKYVAEEMKEIELPFHPSFRKHMLDGTKTVTSRLTQCGHKGDIFSAFGATFELTTEPHLESLEFVLEHLLFREGFKSKPKFIMTWNNVYFDKTFDPKEKVYVHEFIRIRKEVPEPKRLERTWEEIGEPITHEEWKRVIIENFPELWVYAEACASVIVVLLIKNAQPFALVLQGVPGSGKTTVLDFYKGFPLSHTTDKFTPRAFVTHVAQKTKEELEEIDLLPRIKGKVLISPDLTTLFGGRPEEIKEAFSILTRILDGRGFIMDSGVYGTRGYSGDYMFVWIGATTPIPHMIWDLFGNLGARMYFQSVPKRQKTEEKYIAQIIERSYIEKVALCNDATMRFLKGIWREEKIEWNPKEDTRLLLRRIIALAKLVTRLRGKINVVVKAEYGEERVHYTEPIIEEPERCIQAFYTLMRGHAVIKGRTQVTADDLPMVIDIALSSAPWDRTFAFAYLLNKEKVTTVELMENLPCSRYKAVRAMQTLRLLDLVTLEEERVGTVGGEQKGYIMRLKPDFKWFATPEFKKLWRMKLSDIVKPAEELTEAEAAEAEKVAVGLEPFVTVFTRRMRWIRMRKVRAKRRC